MMDNVVRSDLSCLMRYNACWDADDNDDAKQQRRVEFMLGGLRWLISKDDILDEVLQEGEDGVVSHLL